MEISVENAMTITTTCIYLHNFLRKSCTSRPLHSPHGTFDTDTQVGGIILGSWRRVIQADTGMEPLINKPRWTSEDAKAIRNEFMEYFMSYVGRIPWQE